MYCIVPFSRCIITMTEADIYDAHLQLFGSTQHRLDLENPAKKKRFVSTLPLEINTAVYVSLIEEHTVCLIQFTILTGY